jgi:hypothetical protein
VVRVDLGDGERDVWCHAVVRGVRRDDVAGLEKVRLDFGGRPGGQRREEQVDVGVFDRRRSGRFDLHLGDGVRDGRVDAPLGCLAICLAGARLTRGDRCEFERRMVAVDESLADRTGRTEDADSYRHCRQ